MSERVNRLQHSEHYSRANSFTFYILHVSIQRAF